MADQVKEHDNKDQESGRPVQLDPEQEGGKQDKPRPDTQKPDHAQPPAEPPARSR
jgi:hypothetical protein